MQLLMPQSLTTLYCSIKKYLTRSEEKGKKKKSRINTLNVVQLSGVPATNCFLVDFLFRTILKVTDLLTSTILKVSLIVIPEI